MAKLNKAQKGAPIHVQYGIKKMPRSKPELLFHEILHLKEPLVDSLSSYHFGTVQNVQNNPGPFITLQSKVTWALLSFTAILLFNTVYLISSLAFSSECTLWCTKKDYKRRSLIVHRFTTVRKKISLHLLRTLQRKKGIISQVSWTCSCYDVPGRWPALYSTWGFHAIDSHLTWLVKI